MTVILMTVGCDMQIYAVNKKTTTRRQPAVSTPKTSTEAKKRQEATQKEIKLTEEQLKQNEAKVTRSLNELGKVDQQIDLTTAKIKELNVTIKKLDGEIKGLEGKIAQNEKDLQRLREEYLKAVKKMRVTRKNRSDLAFIFSSKSMSQAMRRMRYLKEFSNWRSHKTEEINSKISDLKNQKEALAKASDEQNNALALQKSNESRLAEQKVKQESLIAELKQNGAALESHLQKKRKEAAELGSMVSQLIAQEQKKAEEEARKIAEENARKKAAEEAKAKAEEERRRKEELLAHENAAKQSPAKVSESKKDEPVKKQDKPKKQDSPKKKAEPQTQSNNTSNTQYADARRRAPRKKNTEKTEEVTATASSFQDMKGKLPYPSTGSFTVTSRFGRQNLPDLPNVEFDNPGIDAETESGASARAVYQGKVSGVYLLPGYNTVVIVNHGNYYTVYGNISNASVKAGDAVNAGTTLGSLAPDEDNPGHSSIHFEVWKNRDKLNPQEWLR